MSAQQGVYAAALAELRAGRKRGHWMWFVFPQVAGLGTSPTARHYAIRSLAEARAYLAHPLLGPRLRECTAALLAWPGTSPEHILGQVDALKLRSSLTLFAAADANRGLFPQGLDLFFGGVSDPATLRLIAAYPPPE